MSAYAVADAIDAWLAELESGKHKRTTGQLMARNGAMCCLGVAAAKVLHEPRTYSAYSKTYRFTGTDEILASFQQVGLRSPRGQSRQEIEHPSSAPFKVSVKKRYYESLITLNDDEDGYPFMGRWHPMTFAYIANRLRVDLLTDHYGYFTTAARAEWCAKHNLIP